MSRLQELMDELCPNGVEYKPLSSVLVIRNGSDYKRFGTGEIPVYGSGGIMAYVDTAAYRKPSVLIPRKGSIDKLYYVDTPFWNVDTIFYTEIDETAALPRYIYFCLQKEHLERLNTAGGVPSLTQAVLNNVTIPVPPLPVQAEIVRILDAFTELTDKLNAELVARQKQYEYYRDLLLTFNSSSGGGGTNVPQQRTIADLAETFIGLATSVTKYKSDSGVPLIHNSDIQQNAIVLKSVEFITEQFANKNAKKRLKKHDIITVHTGDVGTSAVVDERFEGAIGFTTITTRIYNHNVVLPEYLCHYLNSRLCKSQIAAITISDRSNLNQSNFEKLLIPVPSISEQRRIVAILDRFDALCNGLTAGLPAEIEARRKQYEYYRDKLLSFKALDA